MSRVFVSYSYADRPIAERLLTELRKVNVAGWMDASDLAAGEAVSTSIRNALAHSDAIVILLSARSLESNWVQFEIGAALGLGKRLLPVIIGDVEAPLPEYLSNIQWLDARGKAPQQVAREIEALFPR
jgi:hypothetical protein